MSETPPKINKNIFLLTDPPAPTQDPERVNIITSQLREGLMPIALIIDNEVVEIMNVQARTAAILLSTPQVVDLSDYVKANGKLDIIIGMNYDESNGKFK